MFDTENDEFVYQFGTYELDPREKLLTNGAGTIPVSPRAFDVLACLLSNANKLVDKETLIREVWKGAFVEEANISVQIHTVRKLLSEMEGGVSIETIPKRGYRLSGSVSIRKLKGAEPAESEPNLRYFPNWAYFVAATATILIAGVAFVLLRNERTAFEKIEVFKLTSSGDINHQTISPDGEYVVYWKGGVKFMGSSRLGLWLRHLKTGSEINLLPDHQFDRSFVPTYSPDGKHIFFNAWSSQEKGGTFKLPNLGGTPVRTSINVPIAYISPDNKWTSYFQEGKGIVRFSLQEENSVQPVTIMPFPDFNFIQIGPWSSDGRLISFYGSTGGDGRISVAVVDVGDGNESLVSEPKFVAVNGLSWLPDSSGLIVAGKVNSSEISQLWLVSYPSGEMRQITRDTSNYFWPTVSGDGLSITAIKRERPSQIWAIPYDKTSGNSTAKDLPGPAFSLLSRTMVEGYYGMASTKDNRIIFTSAEAGNLDVWAMNYDGSNRKQLTFDPAIDLHPTVCGMDDRIVFISNRTGARQLWRMDADGSSQVQITQAPGARAPACDHSGRWVYFSLQDRNSKRSTIWRISIDGGEASQVTSFESDFPRISPGGEYLSVYGNGEIVFINSITGEVVTSFQRHPNMEPEFSNNLKWAPDGRGVVFVATEFGVSNLFLQPIKGDSVRLTDFTSLGIWYFDWSNDGSLLFLSRGSVTSDIVLIRDEQ